MIPLTWRTKNHLRSMYFGALAVGADASGGLLAMYLIRESGKKVSLVFKSLEAKFLKRPEDDVHFKCEQGTMIQEMIKETVQTGQRITKPLTITATTPKLTGDDPVATFVLALSLKSQR
jgi:hypothetical protein